MNDARAMPSPDPDPAPWPALPGHPTRGKRSKLEDSYADALTAAGLTWTYEPRSFTDPTGHYLPDFRIDYPGEPPCYVELKPNAVLHERAHALYELARLTRIWATQPDARLVLRGWHRRDGRATRQITGLPHPGVHTPSWWLLRDGLHLDGGGVGAYHGDTGAARACPQCRQQLGPGDALRLIPPPDERPGNRLDAVLDRLTHKYTYGR
jgi:hypothetical protein